MKGGGIALALSLASMVNTVLLLVLLKKSKTVNIVSFLLPAALFALKITLFSVIAAVPLYFFGTWLYTPLAAYPRIIAQGLPLCMSAALFALIILTFLMITGDTLVRSAVKKLRYRQR